MQRKPVGMLLGTNGLAPQWPLPDTCPNEKHRAVWALLTQGESQTIMGR